MELDDMKLAWQDMTRKFDTLQTEYASLRVDVRKQAAAPPLKRTGALIWYEAISNAVLLVLLVAFLAHEHTVRFLIPGFLLLPAFVAALVTSVQQVHALLQVDFGASVVAIRAKLERLYQLRRRGSRLEFVFVCLLWMPLAIVGVRALGGGDLYAMGAPWIAANVALGIIAMPVCWWLVRHFSRALERTRWGQFLIDDFTGRGLAEARRRVAALTEFEAEA